MAGIRIDDLPTTVLPAKDHEFPAMKDGLTVKLSIEQVYQVMVTLGLVKGEDLGDAAGKSVGTTADTVAAGDDSRIVGAFQSENVIDEDDMSSDSDTKVPTQQSVKAYVDALPTIGAGQTWQDVKASRAKNTTYQNTTGKPIFVSVMRPATGSDLLKTSGDGSIWQTVANVGNWAQVTIVVNSGDYYRLDGSGAAFEMWMEYR